MRATGAFVVLMGLSGAAAAQTHSEGTEPRHQTYGLEASRQQAERSRQEIERVRVRQQLREWERSQRLMAENEHQHATLARAWERELRRRRQDVEVRHRHEADRRQKGTMARTRVRSWQGPRRQLMLRPTQRTYRLQPTPKKLLVRRGPPPLTVRNVGRVRPATGDVWIGTGWTRFRLVPPPR